MIYFFGVFCGVLVAMMVDLYHCGNHPGRNCFWCFEEKTEGE